MQPKKPNGQTSKQSLLIQQTVALHQAGQLDLAEIQYRKLLKSLPNNTTLLTNLAILNRQKGKFDEALKIIHRSTLINSKQANAFNTQGNILSDLGKLDEALLSYDRAITLTPHYVEAHYNRGNLYKDQNKLEEALESYKQVIILKPDYTAAYNNQGIVLQKLNRLDEALLSYQQAITLNPKYIETYLNLGALYKEQNLLIEALDRYNHVITLNPNYAEAYCHRGIILKELNLPNEALANYNQAISLNPHYAEAHCNRGVTLQDFTFLEDALASYNQAIALNPLYAEAYSNRGTVLRDLNRYDEALASYQHAISLKPNYAEAYTNLGITLQDLKHLKEALPNFDRAIELKADIDFLLGYSLHTRMHLCIWDDFSQRLTDIIQNTQQSKVVSMPFALLGLTDAPAIQKKSAEIYIREKYPLNTALPKIKPYLHHTKIRLGYFSVDFRNHPVSYLTAELYETHDRNHFEVYAFSLGPNTQDEMNLRIRKGVNHFYDVQHLSDPEIASLSRSLEIDIAIDLGGFTQGSRTGIFALQTAPIQISYLGYLGTMGAEYIHYLMADETIIPECNQEHYSEKIVYLPNYQINDSKQKLPTHQVTRQESGLPAQAFVFCCFNNTYKITPTTFDSWMRILNQVENSVLLLYVDNETAKINLIATCQLKGINPDRLFFGARLSINDYLARYQVVDLFLDTSPYNAGTTASDALKMGVPVLTCVGHSFASRMAASLLTALNLTELITNHISDYERVAIELATSPNKLNQLKNKLKLNLASSILYNTQLCTQSIEAAYNKMHERAQKNLPPEHIHLK